MKSPITLIIIAVFAFVLCACNPGKKPRIKEGSETIGTMPTGTVYVSKEATLVHVDLSSRIATIRNGNSFAEGTFLIAKNSKGKQTGVLKALPVRGAGLRTADILEGEPKINNIVSPASASESARLEKIYRDAEQE